MTQSEKPNGMNEDGIEFRTMLILSTAHLTIQEASGDLGQPDRNNDSWPVRFSNDCQMAIYVSEDEGDDDRYSEHLRKIFAYARAKGVVEIMFDEAAPPADIFDYGGDKSGFLNPQDPEHRAQPLNSPKGQ